MTRDEVKKRLAEQQRPPIDFFKWLIENVKEVDAVDPPQNLKST